MLIKTTSNSRRKMLKYIIYGFSLGTLDLLINRHSMKSTIMLKNPDGDSLLSDSMRIIGREYLNKYPDERSRRFLLNSIQSRLKMITGRARNPSWLELKQLIMDDFQTDEVVYLRGWALSRTEARLAALSVS